MAIFNAHLVSGTAPAGVFCAFCEDKEDLEAPACEAWLPGSRVLCFNTAAGRRLSKHVKLPDGTWNEVAGNGGGGGGLTDAVKQAFLQCFDDVAWEDDDAGAADYAALQAALYPLQSIAAVYTQSGTVYDTDSLDSLKADLVVTATYEGGSTSVIPATDYTLSGTLTEGTNTVTVTYNGKTAAFNVTVSAETWLYEWDYTDGALPNVSAPDEWEKAAGAAGDSSTSFEAGEGIKFTFTDNAGSSYIQYLPKNYNTSAETTIETVVRFADSSQYANIVIRGSNGTNGIQLNARQNEVLVTTASAETVSGASVSVGEDHRLKIAYTSTAAKVFLDGNMIFSGTPGTGLASKKNMLMLSALSGASASFTIYVRSIKYKNAPER